ncbi:MAG: beta-propeller fold lactonase family protein [Rubrivivax sp.]|nr:beta-propeller fold lactonase family protein [Rubrivivax sp.]
MQPLDRRRFGLATLASATALALLSSPLAALAHGGPPAAGRVYTATNAPGGNELVVLGLDDDGQLTLVDRIATGGAGTGAGLGSQGAVTLSGDGRHVLVVNAGTHTLSLFSLRGRRATLSAVVDSGGLQPISVSEREGIVYVLNAGGAGNVAGFRLHRDSLQAIAGSSRPLSAAGGTGPAQVGFSSDGDTLLVTEKATNRLTSWRVGHDGRLGAAVITPSAGVTPFGFAFDNRDRVVVSEAAGGAALASTASSYRFEERSPALPKLVSAAVPTTQTAACWVAITPNGLHAYTGNAGSSSISRYAIRRDGSLSLGQAAAGVTGPAGTGVTDLAVARSGQMLYALAPGAARIVAFEVASDGTLAPAGAVNGLPPLMVGLAAN